MERDLIIGIHSIKEALLNPNREVIKLVATKEGLDEFKKKTGMQNLKIDQTKIKILEGHALQEEAKKIYKEMDLEFQRVPSQIYLEATPVQIFDPSWIYEQLESRIPLKILALDQVTDSHNGAAIMRTASFFGIDAILISSKGNFGLGPNFSRIASGATEYVKIVKCSALPKTITKLKELNVTCIGLSEHSTGNLSELDSKNSICLVLGAEDVGMSHAVSRVVDKTISLKSMGQIKSLNVSVAAAIAMEKIFGQN